MATGIRKKIWASRRTKKEKTLRLFAKAGGPELDAGHRSILLASATLVMLLWGAIGLELRHDHDHELQTGAVEAANLTLAFSTVVDTTLRTIDTALQTMRRTYLERPETYHQVVTALAETSLDGIALQFGRIDAHGMLVSTLPQHASLPLDVSDRDHYRAHLGTAGDHLYVGAPFVMRTTNAWAMQFTRPILDAAGEFRGVVSVLVSPEYFTRLYRGLDIGWTGVVEMIRDGGVLMARGSTLGAPYESNDLIVPYVANSPDGRPVLQRSPVDGVERVVSERHHPDLPIAVRVGLGVDELLGIHREHTFDLIAGGVLLTLLVVIYSLFQIVLTRRLRRSRQRTESREAQLRGILENIDVVTWELALPSWRFVYVSPQAEKIFGYPLADWHELDFWVGHLHPEDRDRAINTCMVSTERRQDHDFEYRFFAQDGRVLWVRDIVRVICDASGTPVKLAGVLLDITEQKLAQQELAKERSLLRSLLDAVPDLIFFKDRNSVYLDGNSAFLKLIDREGREIAGQTDYDFFEPQLAAFFRSMDRNMLEQGEIQRNEEWVTYPDGSQVLFDTLKTPFYDADGTVCGLLGVSRDITALRHAEEELRESEARFRTYMELSADGICVVGQDGGILVANPAIQQMFGYREAEMLTLRLRDLVLDTEESRARVAAARAQVEASGSCHLVCVVVRRNGEQMTVSTSVAKLPNRTYLCAVRDISDEVRRTADLKLAKTVFDVTNEGIMVTDINGDIVSVNPAFSTMTGWSADEVVGRNPRFLRSGRHDEAFYRDMWAQLTELGHWQGEIWNRRRNDELYVEWLEINAIHNMDGTIAQYVAVFSDITKRKEQEREIWRQANFDALTGLVNRNLFHARLEQAMASARRNRKGVGLLFIDLDRFKWINDTLGHDAGDQLLIEAAQRLRGCVREEDTVARLGGDEFTILLHGVGAAAPVGAVADKVVDALAQPFTIGDGEQYISGSIGITLFPDDGDNPGDLLRHADIAMYRAKEQGKNRYEFYSADMQSRALARIEMEQRLRRALAEQEFRLNYQPIVDADSGELVGAEALLRWDDGVHGVVSPLEYLGVAEEAGLIHPLGAWIIDQACGQWRAWVDAGHPPIRLAINLSPVQWRGRELRDALAGAIRRYRIPPHSLVLELTELALGDGADRLEALMRELAELGISHALDDFGTGYSSLANLKRFPLDLVKIDQSLIADTPHDLDSVHLVEAIIFMAHSMGMRTVAEGVETEAQRNFLRDLGCDLLQGFLVSGAVAPGVFTLFLQRSVLHEPRHAFSEQARYLAALRTGEAQDDQWLRRLVAERFPDLAAVADPEQWHLGALSLREVVEAHLRWRERLELLAVPGADNEAVAEMRAANDRVCELGGWLQSDQARQMSGLAGFSELVRLHREFHRQAGGVAEDIAIGRLMEARRRMRGLRFRETSAALVIAIVEFFGMQRMTAAGSVPADAGAACEQCQGAPDPESAAPAGRGD